MNRVEQLRYERGLTQEAVADGAGVSRGTVIRLEGAHRPKPTAATAKALADFYGVTVAELLGVDSSSSSKGSVAA